jgi:hypothetical protein
MRQQVLQGSHLAPPAGLYGLHDTDLKPAHGLMGAPPLDGVPVYDIVGDRTSTVCCHLLCLLNQLGRCSRDERPDGSLPAFAWGDVAEAHPYPAHYRLAFAFSVLLYPQHYRQTLRRAFPGGALRAYQVPPASPDEEGALYPPVVLGAHVTGHLTP